MNLNSEAYSTDHLDELANEIKDELDDEIFEIADANVRKQMTQKRMRRRTLTSGDRDAIDENEEHPKSVRVSNFSVRRTSGISLADEEMHILEKVLEKRTESRTAEMDQSKTSKTKETPKKVSPNP